MEQLSLFEEGYQPRFQAYLDHVGKTHKDDVQMREFMEWISKHIDDYRTSVYLKEYQPMMKHHHAEFTIYLQGLKRRQAHEGRSRSKKGRGTCN